MLLTSIIFTLLPLASAAPQPKRVKTGLSPRQARAYKSQPERAEAVKQAFRDAWKGYSTVFGADEIRPLSGQGGNSRNGWGATPIDALSTAILMGEREIVNQILDFVPKINFLVNRNPKESVSLFETTIRYLGGLTSAYDLLSTGSPGAYLVDAGKVSRIIQ
jgi:mannosyl-oligosaccharide alpha-1,2-mannosidase